MVKSVTMLSVAGLELAMLLKLLTLHYLYCFMCMGVLPVCVSVCAAL